jgi:hypothetical protein
MKRYITGLIVIALGLTACEKKVDPVDDFAVTVEYRNSRPKALTSDVTLNPKDSIYLDFTITSPDEDMTFVEIQKNGVRIDTFQLAGQADKRSFSKVKGYMADSIPGNYSYRVLARNSRAIFLGDGGKTIKVTINPDFMLWAQRILAVPDTVNKTNKAYMSLSEGKTYSYTEAGAVSSKIDFGYYYDTTGRGTSVTTDDQFHSFYSPSAAQPQLGYYDISSWTKNVTIFKKLSGVNFNTQLTSGGAINTLVRNNMTSGTSTKVTLLATGNVIGFKTADGKYGAMLIRIVNGSSPDKTTSIEIDVKVQR